MYISLWGSITKSSTILSFLSLFIYFLLLVHQFPLSCVSSSSPVFPPSPPSLSSSVCERFTYQVLFISIPLQLPACAGLHGPAGLCFTRGVIEVEVTTVLVVAVVKVAKTRLPAVVVLMVLVIEVIAWSVLLQWC